MKSALLMTLVGAICWLSGANSTQSAEADRGKIMANTWTALVENEVNPRGAAGPAWHSKLKRFVVFGGLVSHEFTGKSGYHVQSFDVKDSFIGLRPRRI